MKKVFSFFVLIVFLGIGLNIFAQDSHKSLGPAPEGIKLPVSISNDNVTNVNSRGFVYLSTTTHQLAKQFMGNTTLTNIGAAQTYGFPGAFARHTNGTIYCNDQLAPWGLYTIDTTTGAKTLVVNITGVTLTNLTGITWDGTQMWGVQSSITASQIGTINLTTGVFTLVGSASTVCAGAIQVNAAPNGTLFSVDIVADNLYKWNKTTGVATLVGALGVNANYGQDGHFDMGDGKYYWAAYTTGPELRIIDTTTGASTVVGTYTGQMSCLAIVPYIPYTPPVWTPVDSLGISLNCVSTVNANVAWIGGAGGKVLKTTNGGANFVQMTNATIGANDIYAIAGIDANTCLVSTSPAATFVFKTTDGGTTFTQVFTQVSGFIDDIRMQNATTGFMYGDPVGLRWSLWKTTNAGTTWDSTGCYLPQAGTESGYNNAMCLRGNTIWFGTGNTRVYKSTNFGATGSWISGATTGSANSYSVSFNGAVGFSGTTAAVKSTDGGATYTGVTVPGSGNLFAFNGIPNTGRFWFCRGASIYNSTDNGATFNTTPQYTRTGTFQAMDLKLDGTTIRGFAVTALGIIAKYDEGGVVTAITPISTTTTPDSYQLGQNYPNPFNPTTKINFALPKSGLVTLKVYDVVGKEVATLVNEVKNVGTYSVDFNASNLSSGIYFYKVSVNGFSEVKKMMLIK